MDLDTAIDRVSDLIEDALRRELLKPSNPPTPAPRASRGPEKEQRHRKVERVEVLPRR